MTTLASFAKVSTPNRNPLLNTSTIRSLGSWHDVLTLQVDVFLAAEIASLRGSAAWQNATTVLEVGCGNGRYLAGLQQAFPGKRYVGLDLSDGLIRLAADSHANDELSFVTADFFGDTFQGRFDAVVMRFVLQHLSDLPIALDRAASHLKPGGRLFVIEPDLANSANTPRTPVFEAMLAEYGRRAEEHGYLRAKLNDLPALIGAMPGWALDAVEAFSLESDGPFVGTNLLTLYQAWTSLCEHQGSFEFDFESVRNELTEWALSPSSRSRISLRLLQTTLLGPRDC